ncbi:MAG: lipase family protein [Oscillospiraceae bacterium]|nr:lipase family protein [Oscillospiraceae bacterium]
MKKRILAILLELTMLLGMFTSVSAYAVAAGKNSPEISTKIIEWSDIRAEIKWGAELFAQPSNVYNKDLAFASIVLSKAASGKRSQKMESLGFQNFYQYCEPSARELPSFTIAEQTWIINGEETALITIILEGTGSALAQWKNNFNIFKVPYYGYAVHFGFKAYADEMWNALVAFLSENQDLPAKKKLLITGHSAGGAGANLLTARLNLDAEQTIACKDDVYTYTFATPNVYNGKEADASKFNNIFNIINTSDIVPQLPPSHVWHKFGRILSFTSSNEAEPHSINVHLRHLPDAEFTDGKHKITLALLVEWIVENFRM